jgi:hypothetical protein
LEVMVKCTFLAYPSAIRRSSSGNFCYPSGKNTVPTVAYTS